MKKLIALFLCLVMVLGLVACGAKEEPKVEEPAPEVAETKEPEAAPEVVAPEQPEEPAPELGALPLVTEETTITIGLPQSANTEDYETNDYTKWLEEQTGLNLDFVYFSNDKTEMVTQLNLMISGGEELPDILWYMTGVDTALMYELGEDGYILDLKDYFSEYGYHFWEAYNTVPESDREKIFQFGTSPVDGALYSFPAYQQSATDNCNTLTAINTKWLEAVGAEMPTTVDELYEVLKKFATEDPNGNGVADEMGLVGYESGYRTDILSFIINAFVYCCDKNFFNATDGEIWAPYTTDEYRQAMIYLNKLYAEGLITPLFYTIADKAELTALMTPADGVAVAGVAGAHPSLHYQQDSEVLYEYAALEPLAGATELGGYAPLRGSSFTYNTFITADCDDPVLAFKLLDFMTSRESLCRQRYGVLGVDWEYAAEGTFSNVGFPASVKVLDSSVYSSQNNKCYHVLSGIVSQAMIASEWSDDGSWASTQAKLSAANFNNYMEGAHPEEVIQTLIYTADEQTFVSSVKAQLEDYVAEARAMFVSGVMDPNDDAQWETYLSNLEAQGLSQYVATAQTAYTRMTAK